MPLCIVKDCDSHQSPFFCLPPNYTDRIKWIKFSGRNFKDGFPEHAVFCSLHFPEESIVKIEQKTKLLKHAAPILCPPRNVDISTINKEVSRIFPKNRGRRPKKVSDTLIPNKQLNVLSLEKVLDLFKKQASSPWGWLENKDKFYFYKCDLPTTDNELELEGCLPLLPMTTECLIINKFQNGRMSLIRRSEVIALNYVAPLDFDQGNQTVIPKTVNVNNFIRKLKARNDPTPNISETLQLHANSLETLGKGCLNQSYSLSDTNVDERLGTALIFLSNQLQNWVTKCSEYNKLPNFVPSTIRMALLVKAQSKAAYATLRDCDQLLLPNQNVLAPYTLTKAPQGLTNDRFRSLLTLSESLSPVERFLSLVIDEAILTPKMTFDSNGMLTGMY